MVNMLALKCKGCLEDQHISCVSYVLYKVAAAVSDHHAYANSRLTLAHYSAVDLCLPKHYILFHRQA